MQSDSQSLWPKFVQPYSKTSDGGLCDSHISHLGIVPRLLCQRTFQRNLLAPVSFPPSLVGLSVRPCIIITGILGRSAAHVNVARRHEWLRRPTSTNGRANHLVNSRARTPLAPFSLCGPHLGIKARLWGLSRDAYMTSNPHSIEGEVGGTRRRCNILRKDSRINC